MTLDIVIVSYNVKYYLEQCLNAVRQAVVGIDTVIWVVDNCSSDGSVDYLEPMFPEVHFIRGKENVGFSRANNLAIVQGHGKYVLLLNPDTIVTTKTIKDCIHLLDHNPEIGSTGVSMYNADGSYARESKRAIPTAKVSFFKMIGLSSLFPKHKRFAKYHLGYLDPLESHEIEVISGAFNMLRRKALDEVGLLDEDFFMYGEDIDLSYRMLLGGWKNWYVPSPMLHYKGESAHSSTFRYVNVFYQAMVIFYDKHFGGRYNISTWFIRFAVYLKALLTLLKHLYINVKRNCFSSSKVINAYIQCEEDCKDIVQDILMRDEIMVVNQVNDADVLLFQKGLFTYDQMLDTLIHQESRRCQLGVYDREKGIIILPREVIS